MPIMKRTPKRKALEQSLFDLRDSLTEYGIGKSELISHINWRGCGFVNNAKGLDRKRKFDAINQALLNGWMVSELFGKRVLAAGQEVLEARKKINETLKKKQSSFFLDSID
jgi:hypothetical protein